MLDMETLNPGKHAILSSWSKFPLLIAIFYMFNCTFLLCTEWNNGKDLKQATVNGALESASADGTVTSHIQVIQIKALNTLFLLSKVVLFYWCIDLGVEGLCLNLFHGGGTKNKLLLHISSGAYLNHHLISSSKLV